MNKEFRELMEKKFEELKKVEWNDASVPMDEYEASIVIEGDKSLCFGFWR